MKLTIEVKETKSGETQNFPCIMQDSGGDLWFYDASGKSVFFALQGGGGIFPAPRDAPISNHIPWQGEITLKSGPE